ncbi:MAG: ZIP family metal transporter [Pirellulales bacterium]
MALSQEKMTEEFQYAIESGVAGLIASVACGVGALPVALWGERLEHRVGIGYALAGGLMFAASVYNLLLPAFTLGTDHAIQFAPVFKTLVGVLLGCTMLWYVREHLTPERLQNKWCRQMGNRTSVVVFLAMAVHSIPEGIAVGVGYGAEGHDSSLAGMGLTMAIAIAIHNIPEGTAVALPMRAAGASVGRCFWAAFLTSLPQPLAAVPACLMVWFFKPLTLPMLGFSAGAMMFLVIVELIPDALETHRPVEIAWAFMIGFCLMVMVQVVL